MVTAKKNKPADPGGPKRVLIVDDDTSMEILWKTIIQAVEPAVKIDWAISETEACSFIESLVAQNLFYDLIIADIFLSGSGTGLDLWLKASSLQRQRFVIVSAADEEKIVKYLKNPSSMPKFLHKPLNLDECMKTVKQFFNSPVLSSQSPVDIAINGHEL